MSENELIVSEVNLGLADIIENQDFEIIFWGNDDVDAYGHGYGFDPSIPEYITSIETKDSQI